MQRIFKWCLVGAALVIGGVAMYFLALYLAASTALGATARAMWIAYCAQLGLLAAVLLYAAANPRGISRQVVVVLALMPMLGTMLLFWFAASRAGGYALGVAAALMLVAVITWPVGTANDTVPTSPQAIRFPGGPRAP
ncbi:MAG: hypothetical protein AB7G51_10070 [Steroidobacteraceae bacterium]